MQETGGEGGGAGGRGSGAGREGAVARAEELLSEDDLAVIHALQLRPRASWTELGRVLGVDPVTVARRWNRLSERGEAWVSISPGPRLFERVCIAYLDIDCAGGRADEVARALGRHPHMLTIERAAAGRDLLATVATRDLAAMSRYTLDVLPTVPGITGLRTRLVTHMFTEGGHWRIAALDAGQRARLAPGRAGAAAGGTAGGVAGGVAGGGGGGGIGEITELDRAVLGRLARDGRASYRSMGAGLGGGVSGGAHAGASGGSGGGMDDRTAGGADVWADIGADIGADVRAGGRVGITPGGGTDISPGAVKRRVDRLTRLGLMRFRCDFARPLGGWPVAATFWVKAPPAHLPDVGQALVRLPETRNCAAVTGPQNLVVQANLHAVSDVLGFESKLAAAHPGLDIVEREITLRHDKLLGHLLDPFGRSVGVVAPDVWAVPGTVGR